MRVGGVRRGWKRGGDSGGAGGTGRRRLPVINLVANGRCAARGRGVAGGRVTTNGVARVRAEGVMAPGRG